MPDPTEQKLADWKAKTDAAGEGWFEWFKMPENTTHIAYVHESGKVYDPENGWDQPEFVIAAAEGHVHKLIRADEVAPLLAAVESVLGLHTPFEWSFGYGPVKSCEECARLGASESDAQWPCPTVRAIESALGGGDDAE